MKRNLVMFCVLLSILGTITNGATSKFRHFVTVSGNKLMAGAEELRFVSFNIPCLHYNEDNCDFRTLQAWRLPNEFEIRDALGAVREMGGQVVRCYTLSVRKQGEDPSIPRHVKSPGQFNEETFRALDKVLEVANDMGIRVIIPFVDNWPWWGGIEEYAAFRGKHHVPFARNKIPESKFWTDPQIIDDFKKTIDFLVNRTNTCTGIKYKDDRAILAWETGNELLCPPEWTRHIAAYIKSLDGNHLVLDGYHTRVLREESLTDHNIDFVVTHHYEGSANTMIANIRKSLDICRGRKPYFVGEFGFIETRGIARVLDTVIEEGLSGALIWSLRYRNRDGGFYWHSEPAGGGLYKAYHWPGFASGSAYDETNLLATMRSKAYKIRGLPVPARTAPAAPELLPIGSLPAVTWRGSVGAETYRVERAASPDGPWTLAGSDISDAAVQYRPLFTDEGAKTGQKYFYRVIAENLAGRSPASNVVGPVCFSARLLVDELMNLSKTHSHSGTAIIDAASTRKAKEDMHRLKGSTGTCITYKVDGPIKSCTLYAFMPNKTADFRISVSAGNNKFSELTVGSESYSIGEGDYGYWTPVLYKAENHSPASMVRIEFTGEAQLARVEITYGD